MPVAVVRPTMEDLLGLDLNRLAIKPEDLAAFTRTEREARVRDLMVESSTILDTAIQKMVLDENRELAATVLMWTGGRDSTTMAHMFRDRATHAGLANTGVGIEETRQFVRDQAAAWGLPLLERSAPREEDSYRTAVLAHGFPGPGRHAIIFNRLKGRAFRVIRNELVAPYGGGRKARVVYIAGRRRTESERRADVPELERVGSIVWVSPMVNWTKLDLNTYRVMMLAEGNPVPVNMVADNIHMSGECLCGCYAQPDERAMISQWYADAFGLIQELEAAIRDRTDIPEHAKTWGWGWDQKKLDKSRVKSRRTPKRPAGFMCGKCETPQAHDH